MIPARSTPQSVFNVQNTALMRYLEHTDRETDTRLHRHQIEAALQIAGFLNNRDNPQTALAVLPTGTGKTGICVLSAYACNAARVLVITPSPTISAQVRAAFCGVVDHRQAFLFERGVLPADAVAGECLPACVPPTRETMHNILATMPLVVCNVQRLNGGATVVADIPDTFDLVIVDEAHHYPAPTWRALVNHFRNAKRLFLTATPSHRGRDILDPQHSHIAFTLTRDEAVARGIIRPLQPSVVTGGDPSNDASVAALTAARIKEVLAQHDTQRPGRPHQAMVLAQTLDGLNPATAFVHAYNAGLADDSTERCGLYVSGTNLSVLDSFKSGKFRTLVVVGRLLEGFDHKWVSVVGIYRNITSKVLFAQFVGRAVRRSGVSDVSAVVVWHEKFKQQHNFDDLDELAEDDPEDDDA